MDAVTTDLGIIKVESIGNRDVIILAHNNLRIAVVTCDLENRLCRIEWTEEFDKYGHVAVRECYMAYSLWKRGKPTVHLKNHSGKTKDGHKHPWRSKFKTE